ncbi:hypothetical protein NPIL_491201, partial [Nephila pilipes]
QDSCFISKTPYQIFDFIPENSRVEIAVGGDASCPRGLMDKASDFESEDCRFESCRGRDQSRWVKSIP